VKIQLSAILFLLSSNCLFGQKVKDQIEINPYMRMDWYPEFSYSINPTNTNFAKIRGTSWGINANYKFGLGEKLFLKLGAGYYRYAFNKIEGKNTLVAAKSTSRVINFPSPLYVIFVTDKYWYNTISTNIGIDKLFDVNKDWQVSAGLDLNNYYTFSQSYYMRADYPVGPPNHRYKLKNNQYFGFSSTIEVGLLKKCKKINIGPVFTLPVYNNWKQDEVFPQNENSNESNSNGRHKWFRGVGFGISCNYSINKK
jgi:hypothetical protein